MKLTYIVKSAALSASMLAFGSPAFAAGADTNAGTNITNTATVNYQVGGLAQTAQTGSDTFEVDRKVNLSVAELGGANMVVTPGQTLRVLTFTVTNLSNDIQDFSLTAFPTASGTAGAHGNTDNFDATAVQVYVDSNGNNVYDSGTDTATFIDELAEDGMVAVFIVASIPAGQSTGDYADYRLTATTAASGTAGSQGADLTQTAGPDSPLAIDVVFADALHTYTTGKTDAARNGQDSDDDTYEVQAANVTVTKTSRVLSDPFNGAGIPKRIPGATVEYCLTVSNTGAADATSVVLTDSLAGQPVTYVPGTLYYGSSSCASQTGGAIHTDLADGDASSISGSTVTSNVGTLTGTTGVARLQFQVTIN